MTQRNPDMSMQLLLIEARPQSLAPVKTLVPDACCTELALADWQKCADLITREKIDAVFCDYRKEDDAASEMVRHLRRVHPLVPVVAVLDGRDFDLVLNVFREGAADVLVRPLEPAAFDAVVREVGLRLQRQEVTARVHEATERALADLVLLKAIGETTSSADDFQLLLDRLVSSIQLALQVESASLMLGDDERYLEIRAARGLPEDAFLSRIAPGEGISGHVFATGEPVLIEDLSTDGRFRAGGGAGRYRSGSLLSVPIRYQEETVGVLNVNTKVDGQPFTRADQDLLQSIAQQASLAIENHKLVSRLRQKSLELERTHADLVRLHRDRTRFVCSLSHELKTPLTSVLGFADLLVNFYDQVEQDRILEYLEGIHREALHLEKLLTGMLRLFAIDSGSENWHWQDLDLADSVERVLRVHDLQIVERDLDLSCDLSDALWPVWGDPEKMALMLDALLDNAIKFNRQNGALRIWAENRIVNGDRMVYLTVCNEGETVPFEDAEVIFQQYSQLGDLDTGKPCGVGIGLATCRAILRQMHGEIFLEPVVGEGTCFGLLLPTRTAYKERHHVDQSV